MLEHKKRLYDLECKISKAKSDLEILGRQDEPGVILCWVTVFALGVLSFVFAFLRHEQGYLFVAGIFITASLICGIPKYRAVTKRNEQEKELRKEIRILEGRIQEENKPRADITNSILCGEAKEILQDFDITVKMQGYETSINADCSIKYDNLKPFTFDFAFSGGENGFIKALSETVHDEDFFDLILYFYDYEEEEAVPTEKLHLLYEIDERLEDCADVLMHRVIKQ